MDPKKVWGRLRQIAPRVARRAGEQLNCPSPLRRKKRALKAAPLLNVRRRYQKTWRRDDKKIRLPWNKETPESGGRFFVRGQADRVEEWMSIHSRSKAKP
jgi:hypothetical protein